MDEILSEHRELRRKGNRYRWLVESHDRALRFHLAFNLALAAAALGLLKMEGPYFSDAIAGGLFLCGFFSCLMSLKAIRAGEAAIRAAAPADEPPRPRIASAFLICLALFHLASAIATVYLTYFGPTDVPTYPDAVAAVLLTHCRKVMYT